MRGAEGTASRQRTFYWWLAGIAVVGFALRLTYVLVERADIPFGGDAFFYHASANLLVDGKPFISPFFVSTEMPAAEHPPLYVLYLAIPSLLGMKSILTHLVWSCLLGTATIVVVGMLGRTVVNERVGLVAAAIAALYANIWAPDGAIAAETLAMFLTALILLLAYRFMQRATWPRVAGLGVACGAAALTRSELVLLMPLLVLPLVWSRKDVTPRVRLRWLGVGALAFVVVIGPWVGFNIARFKHPVYLSTQLEPLLASANCDPVYYGSVVGYFALPCVLPTERRLNAHGFDTFDQSEKAIVYRDMATDYIRDNLGRVPVVVAARVGRILGVYEPAQLISIDRLFDGREEWVSRQGLYGFYVLALLSTVGVVVLRRGGRVVYPFLVVIGIVLATVVLTYANLRFRAPAEIVLAVLAAVAVDAGLTVFVERRNRATDRIDGREVDGTAPGTEPVARPLDVDEWERTN